jgi:hypothetical protein
MFAPGDAGTLTDVRGHRRYPLRPRGAILGAVYRLARLRVIRSRDRAKRQASRRADAA